MNSRFVVLHHVAPESSTRKTHWDFMLEFGDSLRTWALAEPPNPFQEIAAEVLPDHRLAYLDYEGPISNNRGHVTRFDAGTYSLVHEDDTTLTVDLVGKRLRCRVKITELDSNLASFLFED